MRLQLVNALVAKPLQQTRGWVCQECFLQRNIRWRSSAQGRPTLKEKPYYVTSPIFYVNAGIASLIQERRTTSTDTFFSTSRWSSLYTRLDGYSEEMACFVRQKIYTRHGDRRAWNEGVLERKCYSMGSIDVVIRSKGQLQRQGKTYERFATRPTSHSRSVHFGTSVFCISIEFPQTLADEANIDYDHFIRTSDPDHRFAVQHFWVCTLAQDPQIPADNCKALAERTRLDLCQET